MDLLKLPVAPLPNNLRIMDGSTYEALHAHINQLTVAVNNLTESLAQADAKIQSLEKDSATHSKNIQMLAEAIDEVLKDEDA